MLNKNFFLNNELLGEINKRRVVLFEIANSKGLSAEETIAYSQELDNLIFLYQRNKSGVL